MTYQRMLIRAIQASQDLGGKLYSILHLHDSSCCSHHQATQVNNISELEDQEVGSQWMRRTYLRRKLEATDLHSEELGVQLGQYRFGINGEIAIHCKVEQQRA